MNRSDSEELLLLLQEKERREAGKLFYRMFPDKDMPQPDGTVIHARHKYAKQLEFFAAGAKYRERMMMSANRVGKTRAGSYETSAHLTGLYPNWWEGRKFPTAVRGWAAGKTNETVRDIVQTELFGEILGAGTQNKRFSGTGMIPADCIGQVSWRTGMTDVADTVKVRHRSGGWSTLGLKSYSQGRGSFEGTAQHFFWGDEEPPMDVYGECVIRTATTDGIIFITFTPLEGLSDTVMMFMPQEMRLEARPLPKML
jgi:phage terminase large subunit-like protein